MMLRSAVVLGLLAATSRAFSPATPLANMSARRSSPTTASSRLGMGAIDTSDIKNGQTVEIDGEPFKVMSFSIMKQARGAAKTTIKFKNLVRGTTIENTYRSGEKFETAMVEKKEAQFTYSDENGNFYFMDSETFEEIGLGPSIVEGKETWLSEGMECKLVTFKDAVIEVVLPSPFIFTIAETEPNMKGNTSQGYTKPAILDCGATINVPGFLEQGEKIKVDTAKQEYMERA